MSQSARQPLRGTLLGLALVMFVSAAAATTALRRTSTTFDEIVLVAAGARALETGDNGLIVDQPPLMPLLYGAAARASHPRYPTETRPLTYDDRWNYGRAFFFDAGNDPERLALWSRMVGVACLVGLIGAVFAFTRRAVGSGQTSRQMSSQETAQEISSQDTPSQTSSHAGVAALLAATLVAFLPDAIAHAGVAYNDLPLALTYFLGLWAIDRFVRAPSVASGALAGIAVACALGVKFSALALGPVGVALVGCEGVARWKRSGTVGPPGAPMGGDTQPAGTARESIDPYLSSLRPWLLGLASGGTVGLLAWWATTAALYGGDPALIGLRVGYYMTVQHASQGHPAPAFLLGHTSTTGWRWFFPVSFLFKTPVAFQVMTVAGVVGLWHRQRVAPATGLPSTATSSAAPMASALDSDAAAARDMLRSLPALLHSPLRAPLLGLLVLLGFLTASSLNAGFRYALPALPLLCVLIAVGIGRLWSSGGRNLRAALSLTAALHVASTLSIHPWYLSYTSEWTGSRVNASRFVLDSSLDWGQGLLALRNWMTENDVERVRLSYFGSALPAGYGIRYEALPSFLPLPDDPGATPLTAGVGAPQWTAISMTNLQGLYLGTEDPYAAYRQREPDARVGGSILLFREIPRP